MQSWYHAVLQPGATGCRGIDKTGYFTAPRTPYPVPLKTVGESQHKVEHLGRIISPFVITIPGDVINLEPE